MKPDLPVDDDVARNRFVIINLVRIGGTIVVMIGLLAWQTDWLSPQGWPALGIPMALLGLLISFPGSWWLTSRWRTPPES
jgi:hypothetical protein